MPRWTDRDYLGMFLLGLVLTAIAAVGVWYFPSEGLLRFSQGFEPIVGIPVLAAGTVMYVALWAVVISFGIQTLGALARISWQKQWPLIGLTAYLGLLVGYGLGWAPAYYGFIAVTMAAAAAMVIIATVDIGQRIADHFEWRDMGYYATREQVRWTIGFMLAAFVVFMLTNAPQDAIYAEVPGDLAVAGRIFAGLFALMASVAFTTPLRLRPHRARI